MSSKKRISYLERLQFDPQLGRGFLAKYLSNLRLVLLLIITIVLLGVVAYTQLPKRLNPEVEIPIISVATVVPGASPNDIEQLVTIPLEDEISRVKGIDTLQSISRENISFISIQFLSSVDREEAKALVSDAVDSVRSLPASAQDPTVTALDFEDQPIWVFALTTNEKSYPDLMRFATRLEDEIDSLSQVDRVLTTGADELEVVVELDQAKLAEYGISPFQLSEALQSSRRSLPAGQALAGDTLFSVSIDPNLATVDEIASIPIVVDGETMPLKDLAYVGIKSKPNQQETLLLTPTTEPVPAVTFYVYKTLAENIDVAGKAVEALVNEQLAANPGYQVTSITNTSQLISDQFTDLLGEFRTTILLVFGSLLLFLGLRQATISLLTVPLTFLSAFAVMQVVGMSINFLSLFSFLLALGLIVDDTIVVVSAMTTYFKTGKFTPLETGLLVWRDTIVPIWSTTLTTIWSFVPLLITSGIIGEFIKPIPVVVTATMMSSTAIAVLITLPLMVFLLQFSIPRRVRILLSILTYLSMLAVVLWITRDNPLFIVIGVLFTCWWLLTTRTYKSLIPLASRSLLQFPVVKDRISPLTSKLKRVSESYKDRGLLSLDPLSEWYSKVIRSVLSSKRSRRNVVIASIAFTVLSFSLLPLGFVTNEFFPKSDQDEFAVSLELPAGTTLATTKNKALEVANKLQDLEELEYLVVEIGKGGGEQSALNQSSNKAYLTLRLSEAATRTVNSIELAEQVRSELKDETGVSVSVLEQSGGPPAGSDVELTIAGPDLTVLGQLSESLESFLETQPGVTNITSSLEEGTSKVSFVPDPVLLNQAGISRESLGFSLRLWASGFTLDQVPLEANSSDKLDVTMRLQATNPELATIDGLEIINNRGSRYPLASLGSIELTPNPTQINRENNQRTVTISASVTPPFSTTDTNNAFQEYANSLEFGEGYEIKTGGVNQENARSIQSLVQAMVLSAVLIAITMVVQFGSFRKALIVLLVIPVAVSSVFLMFGITGTPLSFPALIGVLSLFGIVVTNSMFIVDKIIINQKEGMKFVDAIADAGASRLEPILLTKFSTVLGLLPITLADPLWRGLGGAIISGLLLASTIMLLYIPVVYYGWMKPETADDQASA